MSNNTVRNAIVSNSLPHLFFLYDKVFLLYFLYPFSLTKTVRIFRYLVLANTIHGNVQKYPDGADTPEMQNGEGRNIY